MENPFDPGCKLGEVMAVTLADVPQFTGPYHHIKLTLCDPMINNKYRVLHDQIQKVTDFSRRPLPVEDVYPGLKCIVFHEDHYRRAIVKAVLRVNMAKVFLPDVGTVTAVHISLIFAMDQQWTFFEHRIITCKLKGLSAFASAFHLRHILQYEIDWKSDLKVTVIKTGVIPTIICHSDTYRNTTVNQIILNYLYAAYDPRLLIQKHLYWPNSLITAEHIGSLSVQINTPLVQHVNRYLSLARLTSKDVIRILRDFEQDTVYLGLFENPDTFERCTIKPVTDKASQPWSDVIVTFIDTGVRMVYDKDYPLRIMKTLPRYPAITSIPPLALEVTLNGVDGFPDGTFANTIYSQVQVTVEIAEPPRHSSTAVAEIFEPLGSTSFNYNQAIMNQLNSRPEEPGIDHMFRKRLFSSLANWKMAYNGQNWGKGAQRIFTLDRGTRFFGHVTSVFSSNSFYVQPLDPVPLPKLVKGNYLLEFSCGCLWDGNFFRVKTSDKDKTNVRVKLLTPVELPEPLPHYTKAMHTVTVKAHDVDKGETRDVPVLQLRKMGSLTASVPPRTAFVQIFREFDEFVDPDEFAGEALGATYELEVLEKQVDLDHGILLILAKIITEVKDSVTVKRKSEINETEW